MEKLIELKSDEQEEKMDLKQTIQVLKDIKLLNEMYPDIIIAAKKDYSEIKTTKEHESKFNMKFAFKDNGWILTAHNLPNRINLLEIGKPTTLKRAVECCEMAIENLDEFYELLESFDAFEIVEPRIKSSKDTWRIIKFYNTYAKIELQNPMNVKDATVTFYGKTDDIQKMTELYNNQQECGEDNVYLKFYYLKYEFDGSDSNEKSDCGICLDFYDDLNHCPLIFCEKCPQAFHSSCLSHHLKVSNLRILNVAIGECPYCKFKIQVNFKK